MEKKERKTAVPPYWKREATRQAAGVTHLRRGYSPLHRQLLMKPALCEPRPFLLNAPPRRDSFLRCTHRISETRQCLSTNRNNKLDNNDQGVRKPKKQKRRTTKHVYDRWRERRTQRLEVARRRNGSVILAASSERETANETTKEAEKRNYRRRDAVRNEPPSSACATPRRWRRTSREKSSFIEALCRRGPPFILARGSSRHLCPLHETGANAVSKDGEVCFGLPFSPG